MGYDFLRYEVADRIATVTLNRADKLNALYGSMREEIVDALERASADREARVTIVTGAGRGFCAGGDIQYMQELMERGDEANFRGLVSAGARVVRAVARCEKPVIAAVNGAAAGAGINLALACDLRIASTEAVFSEAFVKIGMHPDWGGTWLLPRIVGISRALDLVLTGRGVKADEALAMGLVNKVVAPEALMTETRALASQLAAGPPLALAAAKRNLWDSLGMGLDEVLEREIEVQLEMFRSRDGREGMASFREKRKPVFTGE